MAIGSVLILSATALTAYDFSLLKRGKKTEGIPFFLIASGLVILSYLFLASAFLLNNFNYEEVVLYSSSGLSLVGRLYASWASSSGSWLFLSSLFAFGYTIIRYLIFRDKSRKRAYEMLDIIMIFFLIAVLIRSPFTQFSTPQMNGRGLNPLLQTTWMLIHPPIVFIGYVLSLYSFAFTFESSKRGEKRNSSFVIALSQLAWLFLTLGIALGGVWAYEVLGWGGYWAWDPVETASLIPWLTLTAYFHLTNNIIGRNSSSREFMIMATSVMIILATAITRGGLTRSVHAFGKSTIGLLLVPLIILICSYFLYNTRREEKKLFNFSIDPMSSYSISLFISFLALILIIIVSLWGVLLPILGGWIGLGEISIDATYFNNWNYPFVLLLIIGLIGCNLKSWIDTKQYIGINLSLIIIGIIGASLGFPTRNFMVNLGLPIPLFALGAVLYRALDNLSSKTNSVIQLGRNLIHLGVVIILLGILVSSTATTTYGKIKATPESSLNLGQIQIDFGEFKVIEPFGEVYDPSRNECCVPEAGGLSIPVEVHQGDKILKDDLKVYLYTVHGLLSKPTIFRTLNHDYYIVLQQTEEVYTSLAHIRMGMPFKPSNFVVYIKTFRYINLIWFGVILLCIGITLPLSKIISRINRKISVQL